MDASLSHLSCYNKDNTQLQISQIGISKISNSGKPPRIIQQSWNKTCQLFFFFFFCNISLASCIFIWWNWRIRARKKCSHGKRWTWEASQAFYFSISTIRAKLDELKPSICLCWWWLPTLGAIIWFKAAHLPWFQRFGLQSSYTASGKSQ